MAHTQPTSGASCAPTRRLHRMSHDAACQPPVRYACPSHTSTFHRRRFPHQERLVKDMYDAIHEAFPFPDDTRIFLREWPGENVSQNGVLDPEPVDRSHLPGRHRTGRRCSRRQTRSPNTAAPTEHCLQSWPTDRGTRPAHRDLDADPARMGRSPVPRHQTTRRTRPRRRTHRRLPGQGIPTSSTLVLRCAPPACAPRGGRCGPDGRRRGATAAGAPIPCHGWD
jgi:hypothetical protein